VGSSTMSRWAKKNVFERVGQLLRSPNITKPAWYDAAVVVPPPRKTFSTPKPARIQYREDQLLQSFFQRVGSDSYKYIHMPGANTEGPAVAFVRRQMEVMDAEKISPRKAFERVLVEAETQGELIDTAILLASDDQMVADPMDGEEMKAVLETHVNDIATHVTEVYIDQVMKDSNISRTEAETQAVKQMKFESRNMYERLRKLYTNDHYGNRAPNYLKNRNQPTAKRAHQQKRVFSQNQQQQKNQQQPKATPKPAEATPKPAEATPKPAEATPKPAEAAPKPAE